MLSSVRAHVVRLAVLLAIGKIKNSPGCVVPNVSSLRDWRERASGLATNAATKTKSPSVASRKPDSVTGVTHNIGAITRAVAILSAGGIVAFPTETVYGLGADAKNEAAVRSVFRVKGRPLGHPVIVHLADAGEITYWARAISREALALARHFWPGPLTIVVPRSGRASDSVTGGQDSVALRVPAHPLAQALLRRFSGGVIAPSANRFGHVSATTAAHVRADLGDAVDMILDGGKTPIGIESTIVDCVSVPPTILRHGAIGTEDLAAVIGYPIVEAINAQIRVPGNLSSHYAPKARVLLESTLADARRIAAQMTSLGQSAAIVADDNVDRMARDLYARIRAADAPETDAIIVVQPQAVGIGRAICDRLVRAAADR